MKLINFLINFKTTKKMKILRIRLTSGYWVENIGYEEADTELNEPQTLFAKSIKEKNGLFFVDYSDFECINNEEIHAFTMAGIQQIVYLKD